MKMAPFMLVQIPFFWVLAIDDAGINITGNKPE
jgi:hypothetical protein